MFEKGKIVRITGNGEATRYKHGWGDYMTEMLGGVFTINNIREDGSITILYNKYDRTYRWDPSDLTLVSDLKEIVRMSSKVKNIIVNPETLDL